MVFLYLNWIPMVFGSAKSPLSTIICTLCTFAGSLFSPPLRSDHPNLWIFNWFWAHCVPSCSRHIQALFSFRTHNFQFFTRFGCALCEWWKRLRRGNYLKVDGFLFLDWVSFIHIQFDAHSHLYHSILYLAFVATTKLRSFASHSIRFLDAVIIHYTDIFRTMRKTEAIDGM